ncbi:MAG: Ig-like domain-containing protein [Bacteroidales bacterium]|nr:Ig-like domain-containing protein [Bacteroidales bacterium]
MANGSRLIIFLFILFSALSCKKDNGDPTDPGTLQLIRVRAGNTTLSHTQSTSNIPVSSIFYIEFSSAVDTASARENIAIVNTESDQTIGATTSFSNENKTVMLTPNSALENSVTYKVAISSEIKGADKQTFPGIEYPFMTEVGTLTIQLVTLNGVNFNIAAEIKNIDFDAIELVITFSESLDLNNFQNHFSFYPGFGFNTVLSGDHKTITITNNANLDYYSKYTFNISPNLTALNGFKFAGFSKPFYTGLDPTPKFPPISDEDLLTLVQEQSFKYFWDFAHPVSGLARERNSSGNTVTIGGSGFGVMAILVGIERGFISRVEGVNRLNQIVDFLTAADRFHGVWPHWMNGNTGQTIAFSTKDNGGDLVETSFMAAGLLTIRQYLDPNAYFEGLLFNKINVLLNEIEWSWYTRGGQNVLYWHWSPNYGWDMNMQVRGYNEALITYFMAATSSTFPIEPSVYHQGWARSGNINNGKSFYGIPLPVGYDFGGPLFFAHYSFLGLNPTNLIDQYANYWTQNVNHTLINRQHCIENPYNHIGYDADSWGLTASDDPWGYLAHEPTPARDNGTITPTAALSSMPYTPEESMQAMQHFYSILGDKLWGEYGFYDAFNPGQGWWANSYLAIDQGPIIVMIENYRTGLCWDLFMSAPEVQAAMDKLGFSN